MIFLSCHVVPTSCFECIQFHHAKGLTFLQLVILLLLYICYNVLKLISISWHVHYLLNTTVTALFYSLQQILWIYVPWKPLNSIDLVFSSIGFDSESIIILMCPSWRDKNICYLNHIIFSIMILSKLNINFQKRNCESMLSCVSWNGLS